MEITSTLKTAERGVTFLIYGASGSGKTYSISTLPEKNTIIIDAEGGTLTLASLNKDYPVLRVKNYNDFSEAIEWIKKNASNYKNVVFDSISEMASIILADEKAKTNNQLQAYGKMGDKVAKIIRWLRDSFLGCNIFCLAKEGRVLEDTGKVTIVPNLPGSKAEADLPYPFDFVLYTYVGTPKEGETERRFQTFNDGRILAKDRSGKLAKFEVIDYSAILKKIGGNAE